MNSNKKIKVVLVDAQHLLLQGLETLLKTQADIEVVGTTAETSCKEPLAQHTDELKPDVAVIDINMAQTNAMEVCHRILSKNPAIKILAICSYFHQPTINDAVVTGVTGFILKDSAFDEFVHAIRDVNKNELYTCPGITKILAGNYVNQLQTEDKSGPSVLTQREYNIVRLFSQGRSSKDIADELHMSTKTIDAGRRIIMNKLEISSMAELIKFAIRAGITDIEEQP